MKYSLLDIVQDVLAALDGDEVNSIDDTTESAQVATFAKHSYNRIVEKADLPEDYSLFSLTASGDSTLPVVMYRPDGIRSIDWVKYQSETADDDRNLWRRLEPVALDVFLQRSHDLNPEEDGVGTMTIAQDAGDIEIFYLNDQAPTYYTTFNDNTLLFNSIDTDVDTTLQASKTLAYGQGSQAFVRTDSFTPRFDDHLHQLWLEETLIVSAKRLKDMDDQDAQRWARRLWNQLDQKKQGVNTGSYYDKLPDYGRK
jgi:hypothetical protein